MPPCYGLLPATPGAVTARPSSAPVAPQAPASQRFGVAGAAPVVAPGRSPDVGQAVRPRLHRRPDRPEAPSGVVGDDLGEAVLAVLPAMGQLVKDDVAQPVRVGEGRRPDPDDRRGCLVDAPVA